MRAIVVYESIFGNTKAIAEAVAEGLRTRFEVALVEVGRAPPVLVGVDLVVVGGPIHVWSMTRSITRAEARKQARAAAREPPSEGIGVREYLDSLPTLQGERVERPRSERSAAAFVDPSEPTPDPPVQPVQPVLGVEPVQRVEPVGPVEPFEPFEIMAATFDTALRSSWIPTGSAGKPAAKRLIARGYRLLAKPEHFYVEDTDGPVAPNELARARAWGVGLADAYLRSVNTHQPENEGHGRDRVASRSSR